MVNKYCNEFKDFLNIIYPKERISPKLVFDIGSRDCIESSAFHDVFGSKVIAFEPNPSQYQICLQEIGERNIKLETIALSDKISDLDFYIVWDNIGASSLLKPNEVPHGGNINNVTKVTVKCTTVDVYCKENNLQPDLLWIDVQGNELHTLEGAFNTLDACKYVCAEVGVIPYYDGHTLEKEIKEFMFSKNFEVCFEKYEWSKEKFIIFGNKSR